MVRSLAIATLLLTSCIASTQGVVPKPLQTHQVNADDTITFRLSAPAAKTVLLSSDAVGKKPVPMTQDADGIWSMTTQVLAPEFYGYTFIVDGAAQLDPHNGSVRPSVLMGSSVVEVPGMSLQPWDRAAISHGRVDHHVYTTNVAKNLPQNQSAYFVYTPPGYDPKHKGGYPVLYLLHGWSDDESGWTAVGSANDILDSMIDAGKAVPMIVVMPLGYGDFDFVKSGGSVWDDATKVDANVALFSGVLESEVMPMVDREYNVAKGRENHAIAGLSMGGLESLYVGLNHPEQFAYVAGFSSAVQQRAFDEHLPRLDAKKADLRLLWVACGTEDDLLQPNRDFVVWAKSKGLPITAIETPGAHTWLVWRDNLLHVAPLLFRAK
jgi:enterochelin esterase-like enzyme